MNKAKNDVIDDSLAFKKIQLSDIDDFIEFLLETRYDYPYRWFFDANWILERINDSNYIWGLLKLEKRIVGTVICYFDPQRKISILKLLLVHPKFRGRGILNNIFFRRLQERRVVDEIQSHHPNILFAEILINHPISQKMVQKIGMSFCGYFPNKTKLDNSRTDLIPCALIFNRKHKSMLIDERLKNKLTTILQINHLSTLRTIKTQVFDEDSTGLNSTYQTTSRIISNRNGSEEYRIQVDDENYLTFQRNFYLQNITEARLYTTNPEICEFLIHHLKNLNANYTEVEIEPDLVKQALLLKYNFKFTAFIPSFFDGNDILTFSSWKNSPVFIPKTQKIYNSIMEANLFVNK